MIGNGTQFLCIFQFRNCFRISRTEVGGVWEILDISGGKYLTKRLPGQVSGKKRKRCRGVDLVLFTNAQPNFSSS